MSQPITVRVPTITIPAAFEIDQHTGEATGTVVPFCSDACYEAAKEDLKKRFTVHRESHSYLGDFADGPACEHCGALIATGKQNGIAMAEHAYEHYEFGDDIMPASAPNWKVLPGFEKALMRDVFADYHGVTTNFKFVVRFTPSGLIEEVTCRDKDGNSLGQYRNVPLATRPGDEILIEKYVSDGPGYLGDIVVSIRESSVAVRFKHAPVAAEFSAVASFPAVTAVRNCKADDTKNIWKTLSQGEKDYLDDPSTIDNDRVKILSFVDGTKGYLMYSGDSSTFNICQGRTVHTFNVVYDTIGTTTRVMDTSHTSRTNQIAFTCD